MNRINTPQLDEAAQAALASSYKQRPNHPLRQHCQRGLLKATGRTSKQVGEVVGLRQVSFNSWVKCYQEESINRLENKPGHRRKALLSVAPDEEAIREAVETNRPRIAFVKAEWESQRAARAPAVSCATFRALLNVLVADTSASAAARPSAQPRCTTPKPPPAEHNSRLWPKRAN